MIKCFALECQISNFSNFSAEFPFSWIFNFTFYRDKGKKNRDSFEEWMELKIAVELLRCFLSAQYFWLWYLNWWSEIFIKESFGRAAVVQSPSPTRKFFNDKIFDICSRHESALNLCLPRNSLSTLDLYDLQLLLLWHNFWHIFVIDVDCVK